MGASTRDYMRDPKRAYHGPKRLTWIVLVLIVLAWILWSTSLSPNSSHDVAHVVAGHLLLDPDEVLAGRGLWRPLTAPWFHSPDGLLHLLTASMLLVLVGLRVEEEFGARRWALVAGLASLAGSAAAVALHALDDGAPGVTFGAVPAGLGLLFFVTAKHPEGRVFGAPALVAALVGTLFYEALSWEVRGSGLPGLAADVAGGAAGALLSLARRREPRAAPNPPHEPSDRSRVDTLLDRIQREGVDALTAEEKEFLRRASAGYRGSSS